MTVVVFFTEHFINNTVTQFFAKSCNFKLDSIKNFEQNENLIIASYGIKRGTADIFLNSKNFIYIDHGYLRATQRDFKSNKGTIMDSFNGYFRVIKNDFYFNNNYKNISTSRFQKLGICLKDLNKIGDKIIISEPSDDTKELLSIPNWTDETLSQVKKYTDREIVIHNKFSNIPLDHVLKNAFAFISCQSTAGLKAITEGIPAYFTHKSLSSQGNIKYIEKRFLNHELIYRMANSQWKIKEFFLDEFQEYINNINSLC